MGHTVFLILTRNPRKGGRKRGRKTIEEVYYAFIGNAYYYECKVAAKKFRRIYIKLMEEVTTREKQNRPKLRLIAQEDFSIICNVLIF